MAKLKIWVALLAIGLIPLLADVAFAQSMTISLDGDGDNATIATSLKIMVLLTVLSLAPSIFITLTSFIRIIVVMHFLRQAMGTQTMPPNQVMAGIAMFMTFFIMQPAFSTIYEDAFVPFTKEEIALEEFYTKTTEPLKAFMLAQVREKDLMLFVEMSETEPPESAEELPLYIIIPSFLISEMRTAFTIGFLIYIPFLVLDMVIASVLMSMGMMMLPPVMISLPFKVMLFVLVDGWYLIVGSMMRSFGV